MKYISIGDMSQTYLLRRHNTQLKATMSRLSDEMVTGISKDLGAAVGGDFTALSAIDHTIARSSAYAQIATETDLLAGTQQDALELIQGHAYQIGATLVSAASTSSPAMVSSGARDAKERFGSIIGALNVSVAGRYAFSGNTTDARPVADASEIIDGLTVAIAGLGDAASIEAAVDEWFDVAPGGGVGYRETAYLGSDTALAPVQLSETDSAQITITAEDQTIRNMLKGFALATLIADNKVPDDAELRSTLIQSAGEKIVTADAEMATLRSQLGTVESIISDARTRNSAQKSSLDIAKVELIGVDAYEAATALEAVQSQIETLYTLTSRISKLSLTDYL